MTDASQASADAISKSTDAAEAIEHARNAQNEELVRKTALETKAALLEGLKEVFGDGDEKDPNQMRILVRRIPILCTTVLDMHKSLERTDTNVKKINDNITWGVRIVIGAVILALLKTIFLP